MNPPSNTALTKEDKAFLETIQAQLNIVADLSRADAMLYSSEQKGKVRVIAHAHPHSVAPVYFDNYSNEAVRSGDLPIITKVFNSHRRQKGLQSGFGGGTKVEVEALPIFDPRDPRRLIGAVSLDSTLIEYERHRRRNPVFHRTLRHLQIMLTRGLLINAENLTPFGENEGLVVVDKRGFIRYTSGIAANLYRKLGYVENLVGAHLESLETHDDALARKTITTQQCLEEEAEDGGRSWVRKALPLVATPTLKEKVLQIFSRGPQSPDDLAGVLLVWRDVTEERRKEQEIRVKNAMIQEIHHRVKNNLQTIAALLRIQSRRLSDEVSLAAFKDATNRILSIAVIHEFLSEQGSFAINIKEVGQRIITQLKQSIVTPDQSIHLGLEGPSIWLPPRQATACALVTNELLQNAVEHGFKEQSTGQVSMVLIDEGDHVIIDIVDNGQGLPPDFDIQNTGSLGLQITRTLVTEDLQGSLDLANNDPGPGATARITFSKAIFGGEEGWNENE